MAGRVFVSGAGQRFILLLAAVSFTALTTYQFRAGRLWWAMSDLLFVVFFLFVLIEQIIYDIKYGGKSR